MKRLLIAGCGDIARRALPVLGRADAVLHCVPPPQSGATDPRTANLIAALESRRILPTRLVYISASGAYGDCGGARVDESRGPEVGA